MPDPAEPSRGAGRSARWGDLRLRVLSAAVLLPLALACWWFGGWPWAGLIAVGVIAALAEWVRLRLSPFAAVAGGAWIVAAGIALIWLRAAPAVGRGNVLFVLVTVWATDIGAYAVGRVIGGKRLAPRISPGKTWSGALGGLLAAAVVGAVAGRWPGALVAVVLSVVAQAGDLAESAAKRRAGVKDSGALIPGHGGVLDRVDGLLAASPVAAVLALVIGPGVALFQ